MQCERAQEQFSDYIEDALLPAMRQVMEQHLSSCDPCRIDLEQLRSAYALLDEGLPMIEPPPGFRASVLSAIREQPVHNGFLANLRNMLSPMPAGGMQRGNALAAAASVLVLAIGGGVWLSHSNVGQTPNIEANYSSLVPWQRVHVNVQNNGGILQGVHKYASTDGKTYHVFGLHLPTNMRATNVEAYVVQSPDALTNDAELNNPEDATKAWAGSIEPNVSVQVPVAVVSNVPAGTSMTLLVEWRDNVGEHKEVCILPISDPPQRAVVSAGESMYQALEMVAVVYHTPIMLNDAAVTQLSQPIAQGLDNTDLDINDSLADIVIPANLSFQQQNDGSYIIDSR